MGTITNRLAANVLALLGIILVMLLAGCESTGTFGDSATATPPNVAQIVPPRPPFAATQTAEAIESPYVVERVTLATNVSADGVPRDEVAVVPEDTRAMFLSVLVTGLKPPTRFRAFWLEGDTIVAQSEQMVEQIDQNARWVSLGFQSIQNLNPASSHSVELRIDNRLVDTYSFRVGTGDIRDVIADSMLALGTNDDGKPIGAGEVFDIFAPQVVAVVRVSQLVDPSDMIFSAFLSRDGILVTQTGPDGGQPDAAENPESIERQLTFTFVPEDGFETGDYTVTLLINGQALKDLPFSVIQEQIATPTPAITPTPETTATAVASGASLIEYELSEQLDPKTAEPADPPLTRWDGPADQRQQLYLSLSLVDLRLDDIVEVDMLLTSRQINRYRYPAAAFDRGWLSIPVNVWAPSPGLRDKEYTFLIYINGTRVRRVDFEVGIKEPEPEATPTVTPTP